MAINWLRRWFPDREIPGRRSPCRAGKRTVCRCRPSLEALEQRLVPTAALAGYYTLNDNFQHAIVATTDGTVHELSFNPHTGIHQDVLAHFDSIVGLAGYYTPNDNFQHAIVATRDGTVNEVFFNTQTGIHQDVLAHFDSILGLA